jgi:uncharacterized protein (DUF1778 family)
MARRAASRAVSAARVLLRLPAELHRTLVRAAAQEGLSFNEFCVRRLRVPADVHGLSDARALIVSRARAAFGDRLTGVVVIGSWARGDAAATSDIDVLIAIDAHTPLTREHFTHLPPAAAPTAMWCEAAIADGRVVRAVSHGQPYWKGAA